MCQRHEMWDHSVQEHKRKKREGAGPHEHTAAVRCREVSRLVSDAASALLWSAG